MARPGLLTHRKFVRLARLLKSDALAVGHLEIIWQACYESGDPVLGNSDDVEYLARWKGDAGMLTSALVESGFLDDEEGRFSVHDLFDHAPDYVQRRMEREEDRRRKGVTLSELRAKAGRASGKARREKSGTSAEHVLNTCLNTREQTGTNGATPHKRTPQAHPLPASAPAPAPGVEEKAAPLSPDGDENQNGRMTAGEFFDRWNRWAKGAGFPQARKLTDDRRAKINTRLDRDGWLDSFREALQKLPLPSKTDNDWQPDLDWLIANDGNVLKILEGKYNWRAGGVVNSRNQPLIDRLMEVYADDGAATQSSGDNGTG